MKKEQRYKVVLDYSGSEVKVLVDPPNQTLLEKLSSSLKKQEDEPTKQMGCFRGDSPLDD
jgi:hypothetical protein